MINIPEPCHEDFSKMTNTERGAFCTKCSIDTYDFRQLSNLQINSIIKETDGGHLCGRFNTGQLKELNAGFLNWKKQNSRTFQSKFILALILVFGLGLFSCEDEDKSAIENLNQIELADIAEGKLQYINAITNLSELDLINFVNDRYPETIDSAPLECISQIETSGVVALEEYPPEEIISHEGKRGMVVMAGGIGYNPEYLEYTKGIVPIDSAESILADPILATDIFSAQAYPNPTQGLSTIALDIESEGQFDIAMYNINGQLIKNIHSGNLSEGRQKFKIDMQDLNSGMYIVKVISQGQNETLKISKVN